MALNIKINFDNTYDFKEITPDYHLSSFDTELANNDSLNLKIRISNKEHALIPNVYNLAFGPLNKLRAMQNNFKYLDKHLKLYGVKYYVRISRFGKTQYANPFDFHDVRAFPVRIVEGERVSQDDMYNYFIFELQKPR